MFIMEKDRKIKIKPSIKPNGGLAPHARPIISDPILGNRNSTLEIEAKDFIELDTKFKVRIKAI